MSGPKDKVSINFGPDMKEFGKAVLKEVVKSATETGEYGGIGGHGPENHHGGEHEQISVKLDNTILTFRFWKDKE